MCSFQIDLSNFIVIIIISLQLLLKKFLIKFHIIFVSQLNFQRMKHLYILYFIFNKINNSITYAIHT